MFLAVEGSETGMTIALYHRMKNIIALILLATSTYSLAQVAVREFCEELPIDSAIRVRVPPFRSKTTTQKYSLRRASTNVYDVFLNLEFKPARSFEGSAEEKIQLNDNYRARMNSCFRELESTLKDEHGRQLRLHIYNPELHKLQDAPPLVKIKIEGGIHRSNSMAYSYNIDCPTMIHEAFHLLGLIDEYEEHWKGYNHNFFSLAFRPYVPADNGVKPAFDCRALGPWDSVMNSQWSLGRGQGLYSAHVNMIIYPHCQQKNQKYLSCARFAYRTSFQNNNGAIALRDCSQQVPDYCKKDDWLRVKRGN